MKDVALTGYATSGKTTAAQFLADKHGYRVMSFAQPLKWIASVLWDMDDTSKEKVVVEDPKRTGREVMQLLGTEVVRHIDPNAWINYALRNIDKVRRLEPGKPIVVDDVRFPNEAKSLENHGFVVAKILRGGLGRLDHASESSIADIESIIILNNGDKEYLYRQVLIVAEHGSRGVK